MSSGDLVPAFNRLTVTEDTGATEADAAVSAEHNVVTVTADPAVTAAAATSEPAAAAATDPPTTPVRATVAPPPLPGSAAAASREPVAAAPAHEGRGASSQTSAVSVAPRADPRQRRRPGDRSKGTGKKGTGGAGAGAGAGARGEDDEEASTTPARRPTDRKKKNSPSVLATPEELMKRKASGHYRLHRPDCSCPMLSKLERPKGYYTLVDATKRGPGRRAVPPRDLNATFLEPVLPASHSTASASSPVESPPVTISMASSDFPVNPVSAAPQVTTGSTVRHTIDGEEGDSGTFVSGVSLPVRREPELVTAARATGAEGAADTGEGDTAGGTGTITSGPTQSRYEGEVSSSCGPRGAPHRAVVEDDTMTISSGILDPAALLSVGGRRVGGVGPDVGGAGAGAGAGARVGGGAGGAGGAPERSSTARKVEGLINMERAILAQLSEHMSPGREVLLAVCALSYPLTNGCMAFVDTEASVRAKAELFSPPPGSEDGAAAVVPIPVADLAFEVRAAEHVYAAGVVDRGYSVELGHHLRMLSRRAPVFLTDTSGAPMWVLVMVQIGLSAAKMDLPGGKRQLGEQAWACAHREAREEVGIDFGGSRLCGEVSHRQSMTAFVVTDTARFERQFKEKLGGRE